MVKRTAQEHIEVRDRMLAQPRHLGRGNIAGGFDRDAAIVDEPRGLRAEMHDRERRLTAGGVVVGDRPDDRLDQIAMVEAADQCDIAPSRLGRGLGMPVVAEGVETKGEFDFLKEADCLEMQGYLMGRPAPIETFAEHTGKQRAIARLRAA